MKIKHTSIDTMHHGDKASIHIAAFSDNNPLLTDLSPLTEKEYERYHAMNSQSKRDEFLLVRHLAKEICHDTIIYNSKGAPSLSRGEKYISISHCNDAVAMMISDEHCGLDIELKRRAFKKLAQRIVTPGDTPITDDNLIAVYWCCKEAIYKQLGGETEAMLEEINITGVEGKVVNASIKGIELSCTIWESEDMILAYTNKAKK